MWKNSTFPPVGMRPSCSAFVRLTQITPTSAFQLFQLFQHFLEMQTKHVIHYSHLTSTATTPVALGLFIWEMFPFLL